MFLVANPLLAARISDSSFQVALVTAFGMLPWMLVSLHAGAIVDRVDKRKLLIAADLFRGVVVGGLCLVVAFDAAQIWMLWLLALCLGVAEVFFDNASQAILPYIVEPDLLEKANGRRYSAEMTANLFVGTPLGGALFALAIALPFGADAVSYLASAVLVLGLRGNFRAPRADADAAHPSTTLWTEIRAGFAWLWHSRIMRGLAVTLAITNLGLGMTPGLFVLYMRDELHLGDGWYGTILGIIATGGILAGLVGERIVARLGRIGNLYMNLLLWLAVMLTIGLFPVIPIVLIAEALGAFTVTLWNIGSVSLRQQLIPQEMFGRVNSVYRWFAWGSMPVGAAIGGIIADQSNQRVPYLAAAICIAVGIAVMSKTVTRSSLAAAGGVDRI
jgi:MFS family permease